MQLYAPQWQLLDAATTSMLNDEEINQVGNQRKLLDVQSPVMVVSPWAVVISIRPIAVLDLAGGCCRPSAARSEWLAERRELARSPHRGGCHHEASRTPLRSLAPPERWRERLKLEYGRSEALRLGWPPHQRDEGGRKDRAEEASMAAVAADCRASTILKRPMERLSHCSHTSESISTT